LINLDGSIASFPLTVNRLQLKREHTSMVYF